MPCYSFDVGRARHDARGAADYRADERRIIMLRTIVCPNLKGG